MVFMRLELLVNVPVAILLRTVRWIRSDRTNTTNVKYRNRPSMSEVRKCTTIDNDGVANGLHGPASLKSR